MFDPTILPMAMAGTSAKAACTDTSSSGVDVPKPTTVRPISRDDMPSRFAIPTLPRTKASPPKKRPINPTMMKM